MSTPLFVTTEWLSAHMFDANLRIVDGSWYMPQENRDPAAEFRAAHIPGAVFFDIDGIADQSTGLPHMIASPEVFAREAGNLGISDTDTIIVYDGTGLFTAARVWWNFRIMGARDVRVLEGGLPKWVAEGRPLASGDANPVPATFKPDFSAGNVKKAADVLAALNGQDIQVVDVRSAERFAGIVPEPRPGLRSGHMPGALNLPFTDFVADGKILPPNEFRALLSERGIDPHKPIISSCGSGVTATLLNLALASLGVDAMQAYDGSWTEWGADEKFPVVRD